MSDRKRLLELFFIDRRRAHEELFRSRHKHATPEFHSRIIARLHGKEKQVCIIGFRGGAKSTLAEEALVLLAGFREFHTGLILGASEQLAIQRLHAVRRMVEKNMRIKSVFGDLRGRPWTDTKIEFSNGISITAMGKGQALRGSKEEEFRPDLVIADDIEDKQSVSTADGRDKIQGWFLGEVLPALDTEGRVVVLANILDAECLAEKLKHRDSGFVVDIFPCQYIASDGQWCPTWPDRFPLETLEAKRRSLYALGRSKEWEQEYMCRAVTDRTKPFRQDMRRVEPRVRLWESVYVMYDPARTVGQQAATTGKAIWSWIGPRLHFWHLSANQWMPDQIVKDMLQTNETWHPVKMGFEQDGLNQWALQPIRMAMAKHGNMLPLVPVKAPQGKMDFIKGLQIYFTAREVWFSEEFPEAWAQFLGFPGGNIDAPNAAAYALHPSMKPGIAMIEDFTTQHVVDELTTDRSRVCWLALNATGSVVTGILAQFDGDRLTVLADYVREGDPKDMVIPLVREAMLEAGKTCELVATPIHFDRYNNFGLVQALRRANAECRCGAVPDAGRNELRSMLRRMSRGLPAVHVSSRARWTLNALSGGYCRAVLKGGILSPVAEEGVYKTLAEGLESFVGLMRVEEAQDTNDKNLVTTADGRQYHSALPRRR